MTNPSSPTSRGNRLKALLAAALLSTTLAGGVAWYNAPAGTGPLITAAEAATPPPASQLPGSFADLAERVKPSVVQITTTQVERARARQQIPPELRGTPFEEFFRRFGGPNGPEARRGHALGSGFVVDPAGYIVTNNHVVGNATEIVVNLSSGEKYPATVIGRDERTDLALLKIEPKGPLQAVSFGGDEQIRVGDWVMAVGNPFGLGGTVTVGVLSARGRDLGSGPYDDFLQIDAPINSGNSGGPTFDTQGRVIGINTAIVSPNGGSVGIGFAVPAAVAKPVIDQLREHGKVERAWLGVQMQPVTEELGKALGTGEAKGALVTAVRPGSPAEQGGLRAGDVVTRLGSHPIGDPRDLARAVAGGQAGKPVAIEILREGKAQSLDVRLGTNAREQAAASPQDREGAEASVGLALAPLDPQARARLGIDADVRGVIVAEVDPDGAAADSGIRPGDVIAEVGGTRVASPTDVVAAIRREKASEKEVTALLVLRQGVPHYVALPLGRA